MNCIRFDSNYSHITHESLVIIGVAVVVIKIWWSNLNNLFYFSSISLQNYENSHRKTMRLLLTTYLAVTLILLQSQVIKSLPFIHSYVFLRMSDTFPRTQSAPFHLMSVSINNSDSQQTATVCEHETKERGKKREKSETR